MGDSFLHEVYMGGESTSGEHYHGQSVGGTGVNDSLVAGHWGRTAPSMRRQGKVEWTVLMVRVLGN